MAIDMNLTEPWTFKVDEFPRPVGAKGIFVRADQPARIWYLYLGEPDAPPYWKVTSSVMESQTGIDLEVALQQFFGLVRAGIQEKGYEYFVKP